MSPLSVLAEFMPFVVSLSNHERPFDRLRANGLDSIFVPTTLDLLVLKKKAQNEMFKMSGRKS